MTSHCRTSQLEPRDRASAATTTLLLSNDPFGKSSPDSSCRMTVEIQVLTTRNAFELSVRMMA
jgi:hypothetical protein